MKSERAPAVMEDCQLLTPPEEVRRAGRIGDEESDSLVFVCEGENGQAR